MQVVHPAGVLDLQFFFQDGLKGGKELASRGALSITDGTGGELPRHT